MKFSELSYRDYIAIEVVGHFAGSARSPQMAATAAYAFADAMLKEAGKRDHEMEELRERAALAERTLQVLRPVWAQGWTSDGVAAQASANALSELWAELGVQNQTDALSAMRELQERNGL